SPVAPLIAGKTLPYPGPTHKPENQAPLDSCYPAGSSGRGRMSAHDSSRRSKTFPPPAEGRSPAASCRNNCRCGEYLSVECRIICGSVVCLSSQLKVLTLKAVL